jgi:ABC-type Co2+ transport system permease subunit
METEESTATGWVVWVLFGGIALVLLGTVHLCVGSLALADSGILAGTRADRLLPISLTALGWLHMAIGALAVITGAALFRGARWARITAILLAALGAFVDFTFLNESPVWSGIAIVLSALVIWAVARHGAEVADAQGR